MIGYRMSSQERMLGSMHGGREAQRIVTTDDGGLFRQAREAAERAAAEEAAAEEERERQEREAVLGGAIRYSRAVLQLDYDPPWTIAEGQRRERHARSSAHSVIGGLQWRYYSDPDLLGLIHPNPSCDHKRVADIKSLVDLGKLFDQDGKAIDSAWPECDGCQPNYWY
jgi:hypothetical protein